MKGVSTGPSWRSTSTASNAINAQAAARFWVGVNCIGESAQLQVGVAEAQAERLDEQLLRPGFDAAGDDGFDAAGARDVDGLLCIAGGDVQREARAHVERAVGLAVVLPRVLLDEREHRGHRRDLVD